MTPRFGMYCMLLAMALADFDSTHPCVDGSHKCSKKGPDGGGGVCVPRPNAIDDSYDCICKEGWNEIQQSPQVCIWPHNGANPTRLPFWANLVLFITLPLLFVCVCFVGFFLNKKEKPAAENNPDAVRLADIESTVSLAAVPSFNSRRRDFFLFGHPIGTSPSPLLHNTGFKVLYPPNCFLINTVLYLQGSISTTCV